MSHTKLLILAATLSAIASAQKVFDVSTVKPNSAGDNRVMLRIQPGGNFTATGITLKLLIQQAYDVRDFQISGGAAWIATERWDIQAKSEGVEGQLPIDEFRPMLRALIEERFQLKVHQETKEMPVYALLVAKSGPKLEASTTTGPGPMIRMGRGSVDFKKTNVAMLATQLSQLLGRQVVDKTEVKGEFDFKLEWTPEPGQGAGPLGPIPGEPPAPADSNGPTIFTALQEQLGLRVDSQRGPVQMIVIDRVEKPSEN